jgi:transposase
MNEREFNLIAKLIRSRDPACTAARLVLVSGYSNQEAATEAGCSYNSVTNTVSRFKAAHKEISAVFGRKSNSA